MSVGSVLVICFVIVNMYWSFVNWRSRANDMNLYLRLIAEAREIRERARHLLCKAIATADSAQNFKVCGECGRIKPTADTETTCVECMATLATKG